MHTITLTAEQRENIALAWIKEQQKEFNGYHKVLHALLSGAHFAVWAWDDALLYGVTLCGANYCVRAEHILEDLKQRLRGKQE